MLLFLFLVSFAVTAFAQTNESLKLNLISPLDYQVFQRQTPTGGKIVVEVVLETKARGALTNLEKLEVQLVGGVVKKFPNWQPLPFDNRVRHFRAELAAPSGGWYRLEVRLVGNGTNVAEANVEHVGVGEVFVIAGQSNAANHGEEKQEAKNPLVVVLATNHWQHAADPEPGASGVKGSFMPAFGDAMAKKFNVPIGIVAIAEGSTSVREWLPKNELMAAPPTTGRHTIFIGSNSWVSTGELFNRIITAQQMLGPNGFRAVLWHQGESDVKQPAANEISPAIYREYLQHVIETSRVSAGWRVPWFVAQVSYHSPEDQGTPELRDTQKSLVKDGMVLAGPNTDELGPEFREKNGKGIHFNARGLQKHGELWAQIVGDWLTQQMAEK
ncbi:MAG TPA: sialate O-acetylesterase [Candidatus Baltobacteraceae bacterium]|nr:sialate O-acetylesterase [Candidatus Baltobacteraceae bacterium]